MKLVNLGRIIICAVLLAGCATVNHPLSSENASEEGVLPVADGTIQVLHNAAKDFAVARDAGDGVSMARAAILRFEVSTRYVSGEARAQLAMKTHELLRQARVTASADEVAQSAILKLIEEADIGASQGVASKGDLLSRGSLIGIKNKTSSRQVEVYTLDAGEAEAIELRVTAEKGLIVYVEASELAGIVLSIRENHLNTVENKDKPALCEDTSKHGILICRWRPLKDSTVKIMIENTGKVSEPVLMITNQ